jgi:hypothetical protein
VDTPANQADAKRAGREIQSMFADLGLKLHPTKTDFSGKHALELLGIVVDTRRQLYLLFPKNCARSPKRPDYSAKIAFDANDDVPFATCKGFVDWPIL